MPLKVDAGRCPQNHICPLVATCPAEAITQIEYELPKIDADKCQKCGLCIKSCGMQAIYKVE